MISRMQPTAKIAEKKIERSRQIRAHLNNYKIIFFKPKILQYFDIFKVFLAIQKITKFKYKFEKF